MATKRKPVPAPVITKEQYDAMTPTQRRVALAKDALALLDAGVAKAASTYLGEISPAPNLSCDAFVADPRCYVCARGILAVSWARIADDFESRGMSGTVDIYKAARDGANGFLKEVFGDEPEIFEEIEDAFEIYLEYRSESKDANPGKVKWARRYKSRSARLRAICRSLIANNGAFIPVPASGGAS